MLEKVSTVKVENDILDFSNIGTDEIGKGICFVTGGRIKTSRINRPFVTLFLQDSKGLIIPGYIFDVDNFKNAGLDLTKVTQNLVLIKYQENYLQQQGLTLLLKEVSLIKEPPMEYIKLFTGSVEDFSRKFDKLTECLSEELNMKVTMPYTICTAHHIDYSQGRVGGLVNHYWEMFRVLSSMKRDFNPKEEKQLYGTLLLYIYAHSNYIRALDSDEADINLVTQLTSAMSRYVNTLGLGSGAVEIVHLFFGYEPKDIFVRLVLQTSKFVSQTSNEISLWRTLPVTREGNAGYGTIKKYISND